MYRSRQNVVASAVVVVVMLCVNRVVVYGASAQQRTNDETKANCELVRPFFEMRNISYVLQKDEKYGPVCNGKCCSHSTEADLRNQVQRDFSSLLRHNSRSLQGLLDTTASTLQDHVTALTRQSENKTLVLFSQVYRRMAVLSQGPITALYADVRRYLQVKEDSSAEDSALDIKESVVRLFVELFPLVYHHNINTQHARDFTPDYKVCLRETMQEVQPFGDIPRQISQSLAKSLEATRLLLQALTVGVEVLGTTDTLLRDDGSSDKECHEALLRMSYCPKCLGLHQQETKPCSGYCLNVLRGCLTRHVTELDAAWSGYVEALERLVVAWKQHNNEAGVNADAVIRALDTRISEAIMYAMENTPELEKRVKKACGLPKLSDKEDNYKTTTDASAASGKTSKPQRMNVSMRDNPPPETQLLHFLTSIAKSRGFYTTLADNLCKDDSFAETKDQNCWNGQRIGEYTKTVVDTGLGMQKYNPELKITSEVQSGDPKIANLADKLRHVHNMVITSLGSVNLPEADSYMQDAAADGSGSGQGGRWQDEDDDEVGGSGSGNGPHREVEPAMVDNKGRGSTPQVVETVPVAGSPALRATLPLTLIITIIVHHVYQCVG